MPTAIINGKTVVVPKGHEVVEIDGEKRIVSAGEAKKLLKALKEAARTAAAAGGGAAPVPKRDLRTNAEKVQDANLAEIDAEAAANPEPGLWNHYRSMAFYRVEEVDGLKVRVSHYTRMIIKKDRLAEFITKHPDVEIVEPEFIRVRKINPNPRFSTTAVMCDQVEIRWTSFEEVEVTKGLLKEDGRRIALRELKPGAVVAVRREVVDVMRTVWVSSGPGSGHHKDMWVPESHSCIYAVIPDTDGRFDTYELEHVLRLE